MPNKRIHGHAFGGYDPRRCVNINYEGHYGQSTCYSRIRFKV